MPFRLLRVSLRNYKRILLLSIGIILAVSLIAGINIGVDAISRGVLSSFIKTVPYDMSLSQQDPNTSYVQVSQQLSALTDIAHVEPVIGWNPYFQGNLSSPGGNLNIQQFTLVGLNPSFASKYNVTITQGTWNLTQGIVLPDVLAASSNIKPGDFLKLTLGYYNGTGTSYWSTKLQVAGYANFSPVAQSVIFGFYTQPTGSGFIPSSGSIPVAMSYDGLLTAYNSFRSQSSKNAGYFSSGNFQILYRIFLNRDSVINLYDADSTLNRLVTIENNIRIQVPVPNSYLQDHISDAINSYRNWLQANLLGFYFFSLPVLPIAWYLAMTSWYMVTSRRRQEFGLLKVRGVSSRQIFRTAIQESIVIGIVGSALGVLAGFLVGAIVALILGSPPSLAITTQAITPDLLVISVIVGSFISIMAAIRPARLAANLEPTEAVKEYQGEETEVGKPWRPTWTWAALALGTYKMLEWLFNFSPTTFFPHGPPGDSFFLAILVFVWQALSSMLIFLGPFLFVYGATKILTRSQTRLYRSTILLLRTFLKDTANIAARALSRSPARTSRIAFLIALTITFGIFVNVVSASSWDLQLRSIRLQVGADVNVRTFTPQFNESFVSNLTAINGISQATPILTSSSTTPYSGIQNIAIYGVDPATFLNIAYVDQDFTIGSPASLFQKMQTTPNATLLDEGMAKFLNLAVGSSFEIIPQVGNQATPIHFTIIGLFKYLPGVGTTAGSIGFGCPPGSPCNQPTGFFYGGSIITSISYLRKSNFTPINAFTFLCKLKPNVDAQKVATNIQAIYGQKIGSVDTFQGRFQELNANPAATSIFKFLELTSAYLFLAAVIGFALISWAHTRDRLREIAIFRSRGASRRQAMQLLFAESFAVLLLAILIGGGAGIISAYGFLTFVTSSLTNSTLAGISLRLVAPIELYIMLLASIGGFLLSILLSAWLSLRKTVIQTIRFR